MPESLPEWFSIGAREIGPGRPVFAVAEISANHNQSYDDAARLVEAAAAAGADAVKLQTYTADTMTLDADGGCFEIGPGTPWAGRRLYDLYREAAMPWEWQPRLRDVARGLDLELFSTAFDPTSLEFLEELGVPAHKIASFEIVDLELITRAAATGKPLILSTGMASLEEIDRAVRSAREAGARSLMLLKCTSAYPAPPETMHLRGIPLLRSAFGTPVGLSDHTLGVAVPAVAVAFGACLVEKHLTLSRSTPGPDSSFSLEPDEFRAMVEAVRTAERALGQEQWTPGEHETKSLAFRRSLFAVEDVREGERFTRENVRSIRPGDGLPPRFLAQVLGRVAARDLTRGTPLRWELIGPRNADEGEENT